VLRSRKRLGGIHGFVEKSRDPRKQLVAAHIDHVVMFCALDVDPARRVREGAGQAARAFARDERVKRAMNDERAAADARGGLNRRWQMDRETDDLPGTANDASCERGAGSSSRSWLQLVLWFSKVPSSNPVATVAASGNES
jgi:hypothetical protein